MSIDQDSSGVTRSDIGVPGWTEINMVDQGADPNGNSGVASLIESQKGSGNLLYFPSGEYLIDREVDISGNNWGIIGDGSSTTFVVDSSSYWVHDGGSGGDNVMFGTGFGVPSADDLFMGDFDIDHSPSNNGASLFMLNAGDLLLENITVHGPDDTGNTGWLMINNIASGSTAVYRNVNIPDGTDHGISGLHQGSPCCVFANNHQGTAWLENCTMRYGGDNGVRALAGSEGDMHIRGGLYGNSDRTAIRWQGHGNHTIKDTVIHIDDDARTGFGPMRGIWSQSPDSQGITRGHHARNVTIIMEDVSGINSAIQTADDPQGNVGSLTFERIHIEDNRSSGSPLIDLQNVGNTETITMEEISIDQSPGAPAVLSCERDQDEFIEFGFHNSSGPMNISGSNCTVDGTRGDTPTYNFHGSTNTSRLDYSSNPGPIWGAETDFPTPTAPLSVFVEDEDTEDRIEGAQVTVEMVGEPDHEDDETGPVTESTDSDGEAPFDLPQQHYYEILVEADGYDDGTYDDRYWREDYSETDEEALFLHETGRQPIIHISEELDESIGTLIVELVDADTHSPIEGATIEIDFLD